MQQKNRRKQRRQAKIKLKLSGATSLTGSPIADAATLPSTNQSRALYPSDQSTTEPRQFGYLAETFRPIICLAFVLPLLLLYEFGSIFFDTISVRSGVDQWIHGWLEFLGLGHLIVLPLVTAGTLLFLHHRAVDQWQFNPKILFGMLAESCFLGGLLFFAGSAFCEWVTSQFPDSVIACRECAFCLGNTITYVGCGVYEELIFRLLMLNGLIYLGKQYLPDHFATAAAVVLTSLLFAGLHYEFLNPFGSSFDFNDFLFRLWVSVLFCLLFLFRGFGIAVGVHSVYDVLTQL